MPTLESYKGYYIWHYVPSLPAAIVFLSLFTLLTAAHGWRMFKARMWFCLPFFIGGIFEMIGYIGRASATYATGSLGPYIVQSVFLLLAPILFAASLYMVFSRVVRAVHGERFSPVSPRWSTRIFVWGDYISFSIQGNGAGLTSNGHASATVKAVGQWIVVGGLIVQVGMFAVFMVCLAVFHRRFRTHLAAGGEANGVPWQACLRMLYVTSVAIIMRNVYRVVEYVMGTDGYLQSTEWPTYVFDGLLMLLTMLCFLIWYPTQLPQPQRDSMVELTSNAGSSAEEGRIGKVGRSILRGSILARLVLPRPKP